MIIETTREVFGADASLWLFGSQYRDDAKGGDIDLYIETAIASDVFEAKIDFLLKLQRQIGPEKIDL